MRLTETHGARLATRFGPESARGRGKGLWATTAWLITDIGSASASIFRRRTMTKLTDVPANQVGAKVQQLVNSGSTRIECVKQPDDLWTIIDYD